MSGSHVSGRAITTLAERKAAEALRRKRAADAATRELGAYSRTRDGRFVVFGSYVSDAMRFDSDLDLLVDFPPDGTREAWLFAEEVASRHAIPLDIHDARTTTADFLERVLSRGRVLS